MSGTLADTRDHGAAGATIAAHLRDQILRGDFSPGARIRQEDLAAEHRSSRIPAREALRILEAEGLVTRVANAGAWVSQLSLAECQELYLVRERLEPLLLAMNAPLLADKELDSLDVLATRMETASADGFLHMDREFHLAMYAKAETTMLRDAVVHLWNRTQHYRRAFVAAAHARRDASAHHDHHLIVSALRRQDADEAAEIISRHVRRTRLELARHPEIFHP